MAGRVLVIGGGLAGLAAAMTAAGAGAEVLVLDKGGMGLGSNSAMSNGVFAGPTSSRGAGKYIAEVLEAGRGLCRRDRVDGTAAGWEEARGFLSGLGLTVREGATHHSVAPSGPGIIPGVTLMKAVNARAAAVPGLKRRAGVRVNQLVVEDGRVTGVLALTSRGRLLHLEAGAVILAAGGAGALWAGNDNMKSALGQGYALAARAGLPLWDMELVQFYPLVLAQSGLPSLLAYPPYPEAARLICADGRDFTRKHGLGSLGHAAMNNRDLLSRLMAKEEKEGPISLDLSGLSPDDWRGPGMSILARLGHDFAKTPVRVSPGAHFCMGGVEVDGNHGTALPGLWAAGEVCFGLHGANRMGGNALTECLVSGLLAGREAARAAAGAPSSPPDREEEHPGPWGGEPCLPTLRRLKRELAVVAQDHAGVLRDGLGMEAGLARLREIDEECETLSAGDVTSLARKLDLHDGILTLAAVLESGMNRRESRGAFQRNDYPELREGSGNSEILLTGENWPKFRTA